MGLLGLLTEDGWVVPDSNVSVPKAYTLESLLPSHMMDFPQTHIEPLSPMASLAYILYSLPSMLTPGAVREELHLVG